MDLAELQLKAGRKLSVSRRLNNFVRPVIALQSSTGTPTAQVCAGADHRGSAATPTRHSRLGQVPGQGLPEQLCSLHRRRSRARHQRRAQGRAFARSAARASTRRPTRGVRPQQARRDRAGTRAAVEDARGRPNSRTRPLRGRPRPRAPASVVESFKRGSGYELTEELGGPAAFLNYLPESAWPHAALLDNEARSIGAAGASTVCQRR